MSEKSFTSQHSQRPADIDCRIPGGDTIDVTEIAHAITVAPIAENQDTTSYNNRQKNCAQLTRASICGRRENGVAHSHANHAALAYCREPTPLLKKDQGVGRRSQRGISTGGFTLLGADRLQYRM